MTRALLALEDGTWFEGRSLGAAGETFGEVVFNTGMSGYQEVLTDPSYARQIVVMTAPQQGNYGVNADDPESRNVQAAGFVVREAARRPSSWRSEASLAEYLAGAGIVGIEGLDTRELTLHIRDAGAMRAAISTVDLDPASLAARAGSEPGMAGADLARAVSRSVPYEGREIAGPPVARNGRTFRVAALDWGLKLNSLRMLARSACETVVFPAATPAGEILGGGFDGVFLSNGPGDPAATAYAIDTTRELLGRVPLFGICLGHQILALALGGHTFKMKFGHRGSNQPVLDVDTGRVEITSHNHGFAVDPTSFDGTPSTDDLPGRGGRSGFLRGLAAAGFPMSMGGATSGDAPSVGRIAAPEVPRVHRRSGDQHHVERMSERPPREPAIVETAMGRVALTHWNLNDGTLEGLRCLDVPAFSVQYHPEAAPGPHDAAHLFERFVALMGAS